MDHDKEITKSPECSKRGQTLKDTKVYMHEDLTPMQSRHGRDVSKKSKKLGIIIM